ncbi:MAG: hypothetical protein ABI679_13885, partial [Gemmatimonadota bacterium]
GANANVSHVSFRPSPRGKCMRSILPVLAVLSVLAPACSHSDAFPPGDFGTDQPYIPGPPARLTANAGADGDIGFSPDGRYLISTVSHRCIAFLPSHQARDSRWLCAFQDSVESDGYSRPTLAMSGQLAFILTRQRPFESGPFFKSVLVAPLADLRDTIDVVPVPFRTGDGILHTEVTRMAWLRMGILAILADGVVYLTNPLSSTRPRVFTALTLPARVATIQSGRSESVLYLGLAGDSRVLAWDANTGEFSTIYDAGAVGSGLVSVGSTYLAIVMPSGLLRVNLATGASETFPTYNLAISELAMSPDGSDIIVSAFAAGSSETDLYRLGR